MIWRDKMKKDKEKTKVIFRIWPDGEVIALFPQIAGDSNGYECMSYLHIGQHGGASTQIVLRQTKLARPKEYAPLLRELRRIGYNVRIAKRCTYRDQQIRQQQYGRV
jgi:hypothetical protein